MKSESRAKTPLSGEVAARHAIIAKGGLKNGRRVIYGSVRTEIDEIHANGLLTLKYLSPGTLVEPKEVQVS